MTQPLFVLFFICLALLLAASYFAGAYFRRKDFEKLYNEQSEAIVRMNSTIIKQHEQIRDMSAVIEEYRKIIKND